MGYPGGTPDNIPILKPRRRDEDPHDAGGPKPAKGPLSPTGSFPAPESEIIKDDEIEILEGDVFHSVIDGTISIDFSERIQSLAVKSLDLTVVVKLLGRWISYNTLRGKLYDLWKLAQPFHLMDIENDYFLVTFRTQPDFLKVISEGQWTIFGSYLTIEPWLLDFSTSQTFLRKVVSSIQLLELPVTLYKRIIINEIGEYIGPVIRIDYQTDSGKRVRFAHMAISIDLQKPLISKLIINGNIQIVKYESLPTICHACGKYGHMKDNCPDLKSSAATDIVKNL
ncbi:uncharacterized protein LOC120201457 [Hibiscus syriacus]|uniref:uncharacterized protein LOC120201457 n=1 Tax=Hibiscus syriacus TaxID=106335 RepID=UPI0019219095|nr:uncharacterized protein LOC120201457 [Hibiscus syriacus]